MKRWSTKDLEILRPPADGRPGDGILTFTDRYSVYDFGVMPDEIPGKGIASATMAVHSFGLLAAAGVPTHFVEQVSERSLRIRLLEIDFLGKSAATGPAGMIPLQVVYRNALPRESSVHRRTAAGTLDPALVPPYAPSGAPWLAAPMVEFTTKFEDTDRFVTAEEAALVGRVTPADLAGIADLTRTVAGVLTAHADAVGLRLADGKAEYGFDEHRRPLLIDHVGTPDENRFYFRGTPVCKELLRLLHPGLRDQVQESVRNGTPRSQWPRPERLSDRLVTATAEVYQALTALWTGGRPDTPQPEKRLTAAVTEFHASLPAPQLLERVGLVGASAD
ncbi:phosphoribosylaminoimidazolesuccinocarboxamide synthase [Streptomyces kaniharaensis]|uniref:Phosphoribosylaminoimidazole-succinocarboxamide synthase n=1 Tax=Streptomyces kaniharaensis TaxID=212423 RepID=A0A5S9FY43_9ACTN|nr:phosphoribosylaminoimidazolesuccinocarboxamide synthase [Streptomyces kaniharaensis]AVW82932.1 SAICAR synthetase [Streptomyces kaniharaensis]MQS11321.1 phosphoribosylaminoimidazolesuccinocarboxamide synthase [Streptomyces kaniharaensis]QTK22506.1 SAICAR synthetase [Streptomyces kaniharaensis]